MRRTRRGVRLALTAFLGITAVLFGVIGTGGPAFADTPRGHLTWVNFRLGDTASDANRISYSSFLGSLRNAAGHLDPNPNVGMRTQNAGIPFTSNGLIMLNLSTPNDQGGVNTARVWVNPSNLYVWGFSNQAGTTWSFSDHTPSLTQGLMESPVRGSSTTILPSDINRNAISLGYAGGYTALSQVAQRSVTDIQVGFFDMRASIQRLATVTAPTGAEQRTLVARALQTIIQSTVEASRLNDVEGIWRTAMTGYSQAPTPLRQHELETHWQDISRFLYARVNGSTGTLTIPNVGTLRTTADARAYLGIALGSA